MSIEKSLNVQINLTKTGSGAEDAQKATHDVAAGTEAVSKATRHATDETKEYSKANEEHKDILHAVNLETGENRRIVAELTQAFGPAVEAARAFLNPLTGGLGLALGLFAEAKQKLVEMDEEMDKRSESMAERWSNLAEAIEDANLKIQFASDATTKKLQDLDRTMEAIKQRTEEAIEAAHRAAAAQKEITAAVQEYILAKLQASGMDKDSLEDMQKMIKSGTEHRNDQAQSGAEQSEINAKRNQLDNAILDQHRLQGIVDKLGPGEADRQGRIKDSSSAEDHYKKMIADGEDAVAKQTELIEELEKRRNRISDSGLRGLYEEGQVKPAQEKLGELETERGLNEHALEQQKRLTAQRQLEQKNYEDAKAALQKINDEIRDLTAAAAALQQIHTQNDSTRGVIEQLHSGVITSQGEASHAIISVLNSILSNAKSQIHALQGAHQNTQALQQQTAEIQRMIDQLTYQIDSAHSRITTSNQNNTGH